ncbi:MAG: YlxR family protein [Oscillospiraceae bacterium]|nr:YlxR family protein [Oscillospiraceae bacterium]
MKKIPLRMCTGCGEMKAKKELVRVVRSKEGEISLDLTGKKSGRGAYVCPNLECLKKARKTRRIERSLEVKIPDELYDAMEQEMANR